MSSCAALSLAGSEPLAGTAATARTWLLIEQPGPWGHEALMESHLDGALGESLRAAADGTGVRVALIRRPGLPRALRAPGGAPLPDDAGRSGAPRRVFAAHTAPGRAWIRTVALAGPEALPALRDLDLGRLGAGEHGGLWEPYAGEPLALVCTNGRRDRCCALRGRPLAAELAASGGAEVWEITPLGGHRFSPTLLVLPHGYAYGRMTAVAVKGVLEELRDGRVVLGNCRGRSSWDRTGQAAELAVRALVGERDADALAVSAFDGTTGTVTVDHADGRRWRAAVDRRTTGAALPASCDAAPEPQPVLTVTGIDALR
ncbi:sucrase ferredoxin [Streptomyces sp. 6N223]|uniref:sucrase ferredoxin n=1 Tax=Streptomyces sp. 6N223 TaxID=3457412 RepID=UPI003FD29EC3